MRQTKMHANILSQLVSNKNGEKSWTLARLKRRTVQGHNVMNETN